MKQILVLLLLCIWVTANAQVFKRVGPDGQVYFSDEPGPDARQIDVKPVQTISLPPVPAQAEEAVTEQSDNAGSRYTEFTIVSPTEDQGVRANDGNVTISLSLQPELMPGHTIVLKIDGEDGEKTKSSEGMSIQLSNLSRGRHSVQVSVVDAAGKTLIQATPVGFYVLRVAGGG